MDRELARNINTFAPWLCALGTLLAVLVSLRLARKSNQVQLEVRAGLGNVAVIKERPAIGQRKAFFRPNFPGARPDILLVSITNVGRCPAQLGVIYWRPVPWRKGGFVWTPLKNEWSSEFPATLSDGESAHCVWPLAGVEKNFSESFEDTFADWRGATRLRLLRLCVSTSTGDVFPTKPEKELLQLFKKLAKKTG